MNTKGEVIIVGGGLAGLTAGIHLSKKNIRVTIIEKNEFPKHKVCGEYISNEVLPYLDWLDVKIADLHPTTITQLQFSTVHGKSIKTDLPLGGFGISRYAMDVFLYQKALKNGCEIIPESVETVVFENDGFTVTTSENRVLKSKILIGAFGKRSNIDQKLNRGFIQQKSPWLAVKGHYSGDFPDDVVGLHNFKGGYCGVSKVENNAINICYLADFETFKKHKDIAEYQKEVLAQNPHLERIFNICKPLFEKTLTISQISFEKKKVVENHILMIGDTAGLIHPLCGNGMAMAIHSAKIVSELIIKFYTNEIQSRAELEQKYRQEWNSSFRKRMKMGRFLGNLMQRHKLSEVVLGIFMRFPFLLKIIIKRTHGKPITMAINQ